MKRAIKPKDTISIALVSLVLMPFFAIDAVFSGHPGVAQAAPSPEQLHPGLSNPGSLNPDLFNPILSPPSQPLQLAQRRRRALSWRVGVRPSRYRTAGFSRGGACTKNGKITAFVPPPRPEEKVGRYSAPVDKTLSDRPTFWVHMVSMPRTTKIQFTLQSERPAPGEANLYQTQFFLTGQTGLVGVRLPKTAPALQVGKKYLWQMLVQCGDESRPDGDPFVGSFIGSWIERVSPDTIPATAGFDPKSIGQELARASDVEKPALYASLGIWQDAVTMLIDLQQKQPNNRELKDDWRNLLTGAQMVEFINTPILTIQ